MSRRALIAVLVLSVVSVLSVAGTADAAGELPRVTGVAPTTAVTDWFDDHSVGGDNHLSWSPAAGDIYTNNLGQASEREPHDIEWQSTINVTGPGGLEVCGYPSVTDGWMRAYQAAPGAMAGGSCPATEPAAGQFGWFRYVYGRHSSTNEFNRWHLMDLERSALVPTAAGVPTVWDNHWGTCLNLLSANLNCEPNRGAAGIDAGVATGTSKITSVGDVDAQTIPITVPTAAALPNGAYQIVTLTNPYGLIKEAGGAIGSVTCVNVNLTIPRDPTQAGYGEPTITVTNPNPGTCLVPSSLDPALTGPGGVDPMAGAEAVPGCVFTGSHCWPTPTEAPHSGAFINAHSLATGNPSVIPSTPVAQGNPVPEAIAATGRRLPVAAPVTTPPGAATMPAQSPASTKTTAASRRAIAIASTRTKSALRKVFGRGLTSLRVSCRLRPASAATCAVSWRKSSARYSGHVYLRNHRVNGRLRWQYRVDVTKKKGKTTTHIRRGYRTGGTVS